jgi:hypothetical protein
MGNMIPTQNTTKPDDINTIRKSRVKYQDYLASIQANTESDVSNNSLTPETGSIIYKLIQKSYLWLKNNPNANLIEIMSNEDFKNFLDSILNKSNLAVALIDSIFVRSLFSICSA